MNGPADLSTPNNANTETRASHKNVVLATVLKAILPGVGLAYLGKWKWAVVNFVIAQAVVVGAIYADEKLVEHIHWVVLVLVVGSGSIAHTAAKRQE